MFMYVPEINFHIDTESINSIWVHEAYDTWGRECWAIDITYANGQMCYVYKFHHENEASQVAAEIAGAIKDGL